MGLFSKNEICSCCGGNTGFNKFKCKDGYLCSDCLKKAKKLKVLYNQFTMPGSILKEKFDEIENGMNEFNATTSIGDLFLIDDSNKKICIQSSGGPKFIDYKNLLGAELLEDNNVSVSSGGLGRAVAGGILFGGAGAIVGSVTGKKKTKSLVKSLKIKITIKDKNNPVIYIVLSKSEIKTSSILYKSLIETAQKIIGAVECIISENTTLIDNNVSRSSNADELLKLKDLLDSGILTQEEFNNEKIKILNR